MNFLLALLVGAASAFAFQPVGWWPLMPLAFAALCELIARAPTLRRALLIGWGFGRRPVRHRAQLDRDRLHLPGGDAGLARLDRGRAAVASTSPSITMLPPGWRGDSARERRLALVLALAGALGDLPNGCAATMFTGFAWNPVGVALVDTPWRRDPRFIGTYGLSPARRAWRRRAVACREARVAPRCRYRGCAIGCLMLLAAACRAVRDGRRRRPRPIRIVQPNIGQQDKWRDGLRATKPSRASPA